jgi:hypothetical protein
MNNSISESKNYFLKIFFLIQFFIVIIKIEATAFSPINYYEHPAQAQVELVVPDGQPAIHSFYNFTSSPNKINDPSFSVIDYSTLHKYALYYYDNYLITNYRSIKNNFIPHAHSFSILQKKNPCYQSNDKVPLHLS